MFQCKLGISCTDVAAQLDDILLDYAFSQVDFINVCIQVSQCRLFKTYRTCICCVHHREQILVTCSQTVSYLSNSTCNCLSGPNDALTCMQAYMIVFIALLDLVVSVLSLCSAYRYAKQRIFKLLSTSCRN